MDFQHQQKIIIFYFELLIIKQIYVIHDNNSPHNGTKKGTWLPKVIIHWFIFISLGDIVLEWRLLQHEQGLPWVSGTGSGLPPAAVHSGK